MKTPIEPKTRASSAAPRLLVLAIGAIGAIGACRSVGQPGGAAPPRPADHLGSVNATGPARENAIDTDVDAAARPAITAGPSLPAWAKAPETSGELFSAVDGNCYHLGVSILENAAFMHYRNKVARITDDAVVLDPNLGTSGDVEFLVGRWPDQAYAAVGQGYRCSYSTAVARLDGGKWKPAFALPPDMGVDRLRAYGTGAIGLRECAGCGNESESCKSGIFMADNAKTPPLTGDGFQVGTYDVLPSGEVYAVGKVCDKSDPPRCAAQLRWWSPGSKVGYTPMGTSGWETNGSLLVKSSTEVYVAKNEYFGVFDGTKLTKLKAPGKDNGWIRESKDGTLWMEADGKLWERKAEGAFEDISPPGYAGEGVSGVKVGAPWTILKNAVYKRVGGAWQKVPLPPPPFASSATSYLSPESVQVRTPDDVFVVATYHEMPRGWNEAERRRTLLRTKRPKETMRCDIGAGLDSWPAQATGACTTPFVLLASVSATSPKDYDYPQTRAILRAKVGVVPDGSIAEIRENGKVWIGVVPQSVAEGRALRELYATHYPMTRPELLCVSPTITRKIPIR